MTNISVSTDECIEWFGYPSIDAVPYLDFLYLPGLKCHENCHVLAREIQDKWAFRYNVVLNDISPNAPYPLSRLAALIKLTDYESYESFIGYIKRFSNGERIRLSRRATTSGYFVKQFSLGTFAFDRYDIHHSKEIRQGRPVDGNLLASIADMDGLHNKYAIFADHECIYFSQRAFGVFLAAPGRMQGEVVVDKRLIAYIVLYCIGNVGSYIWIVGHAEHLANGVMDLCHHHIMKTLLEEKPAWAANLEIIRYAGMEDGLTGLFQWKRRAGFKPYRLYARQQEVNCIFASRGAG